MGDAYECLGPADENVPDAPPPAAPEAKAAPEDKADVEPAAAADAGQPVVGNPQPAATPKEGLPLRDDDLDFASKLQTLDSKEKTQTQAKVENDKTTAEKGKKSGEKKEEEAIGSHKRLAYGLIIGGGVSIGFGLVLLIVGIVLAVI